MMLSINKILRGIGLGISALVIALSLSACAESGSGVDVNSDGEAAINFSIPSFLDIREIDFNDLDLTVVINNNEVEMIRQGGMWTGTTTVTKGDPLNLVVTWDVTRPTGTELLLAMASNSQDSVNSSLIFSVREDSYTTTGVAYDADSDGISNLEELRRGLDPEVADASTDDVAHDVNIFGIGRTTKIDGRVGETTFWNNGTYTDVNGETLFINNMIRDDSPGIAEEPNPNYQWSALHDGQYLYLFVFGKLRNGTSIRVNGDSGATFFDDDSLEIYLDGNLSRQPRSYDDFDDLLINIPLTRGLGPSLDENNSSAANGRIYRGDNVSDLVQFDEQNPAMVEFHTCICGGQERTTWEVRIDMAAANIPIGKTFGFELQINRDDDGGERDSKWAWAKPPRKDGELNSESDVTWRYPIHMGKARLIPFAE